MATDDDSNLKIGISLDTSKLPADARRAERTIKAAVESTTAAVEQQGKAAEATGQAHTEAAQAATAAQQQTAQAVDDTAAAVEKQQTATQQTASATADGINKTTTAASGSIQQVGKAGTKAVGELGGSIRQGTEAVGGFTKALNIANGVMGVLTKGFAVIGLINQVAASIQLIAKWYADITKKAEDAGRKVRDTWAAQREEARRLRDQNAALDALNAQIEAHDKILAKMREEAIHEAKMRGMRARAAGNMDEAEKATLDGMLARNEISEAEHIDRTRAIDDRATERKQAGELAGPIDALADATAMLDKRQTEYNSAIEALNTLVQRGQQLGLANEGGVNTNYMEEASARWAHLQQFIDDNEGDRGRWAGNILKGSISERDRLAKAIYDAADALNVKKTETNEDGEEVLRPVTDLAREVQEEWNRQRQALRDAISSAGEARDAANTEMQRRQDDVDSTRAIHASENAARDAARQQQDLTLAWSENRAATEAHTEAQRAATEATREEQREELERRHDAATDTAEDARSTYTTSWTMEQERATPEQSSAMAAINRLLTRGEKEPRALEQLQAMLSGQDVTLTEDEARRYGADFQLAKSGALTGDQQAAISIVVQQLLTALQAEAAAKQVGEEVDAFNRQEAATARAEQQAELDRLRAEADAAQARADEATARLQRYETASGGKSAATAPTSGPATAVPEPAPMPPVDDALRQAGDIVQQHNDFATRTTNAMAQFNTTSAAALSALSSQQASITRLTAENAALRQQISNLARANV